LPGIGKLAQKSSIFTLAYVIAACAAAFQTREHGHDRTGSRGSHGQVSIERLTTYSLRSA